MLIAFGNKHLKNFMWSKIVSHAAHNVAPHDKICRVNIVIAPHDKFCCLVAIYVVLAQHPFSCILRTFVWSNN